MEKKRVTVKRMYKGGQKSSGWFGCFACEKGNSKDIPLTGTCHDTVKEGSVLDVDGEWQTKNGWESFVCTSVMLVTSTESGIINYLSGRRFPRVGKELAQKLYDAYGHNTLSMIENNPIDVQNAMQIPDDIMRVLTVGVSERGTENALRKRLPSLTDNQVLRIKKEFGDNALQIINKDPYKLVDVGVPFKRVDEIAMQILKLDVNSYKRIEEGSLYILRQQMDGNMYLDMTDGYVYEKFYNAIVSLLGLRMTYGEYAAALQAVCMTPDSKLRLVSENGELHLYEAELYTAEQIVAKYIHTNKQSYRTRNINQIIADYEAAHDVKLADEQRKAVITAVNNRISCITGGPGRGKTRVIGCIVRFAEMNTLLLAPTGKATRRLQESTGKSAMTIARFLYQAKWIEDKPQLFSPKHIIVDEASMVSIRDMAGLMKVLRGNPGVKLTLVGDVDQLPPIDAGTPFKDIIDSGIVPVSYLTVNHRTNARSIIDNADRIHDGDTKLQTGLSPDGEIEFLIVPQNGDDDVAVQYIVDAYKDAIRKKNMSDVAVLCPVNKGAVGVKILNLRLQNELNKEIKGAPKSGHNYKDTTNRFIISDRGAPVPGMFYSLDKNNWTNFRVGDRVMQIVNHAEYKWFRVDEVGSDPSFDVSKSVIDEGEGVYNGDCGTILDYTASDDENPLIVTVGLDDGRIVRFKEEMLDELVLSYAMTVHKAQGCEYDTVIYVSPFMLLDWMNGFACRNLVYTAVTRAKSSVQIIGSKDALYNCIKTPSPKRNSLLTQRLTAGVNISAGGIL